MLLTKLYWDMIQLSLFGWRWTGNPPVQDDQEKKQFVPSLFGM